MKSDQFVQNSVYLMHLHQIVQFNLFDYIFRYLFIVVH